MPLTIRRPTLALATLALACCAALLRAEPPGGPPAPPQPVVDSTEWAVPPVLQREGWKATLLDDDGPEPVLELSRTPAGAPGVTDSPFGNVMISIDAAPYRGKRVALTGHLRLADAATGRAQLWIRVDRPGDKVGLFNNMGDRPVTARDWTPCRIAGVVDDDALTINIGLIVAGGVGPARLRGLALTILGDAPKPEGPRPLTERGLTNLRALAQVAGVVRHYHPSDEAAVLDWDRFTVAAVRRVETAKDHAELAATLAGLFAPVAPTVAVRAGLIEGPVEGLRPDGPAIDGQIGWRHRGLLGAPGTPYSSTRVRAPLDAHPEAGPGLGDAWTREIAPGVWARVPLTLCTAGGKTVPAGDGAAAALAEEDPDADDRAVRLAAVIVAWSTLQHAYPYFDVVKTDWDAELTAALSRAATDPDGAAFTGTLERLVAALHDGHGHVSAPRPALEGSLPLRVAFVEGVPVVLAASRAAARAGVTSGDAVVAVGGRPVAAILEEARATVSCATEGFFHARAGAEIVRVHSEAPVPVVLRSPAGAERTVILAPAPPPPERTGPPIRELQRGVWYVDVDRATAAEIGAAMPDLADAAGVIFDLRGYPSRAGFDHLGHLSANPLKSAHWLIPMPNWPDRERLTFDRSGWSIAPKSPRIAGKVAFLTDGRAISAAETYMGIVELHRLGEIVGEPTAGTNGNVTTVRLPGGHSIMYTGMKVLKHDGSPHHGVGIRPTVPCSRTVAGVAAGRDEQLERAIELVTGKRPE